MHTHYTHVLVYNNGAMHACTMPRFPFYERLYAGICTYDYITKNILNFPLRFT